MNTIVKVEHTGSDGTVFKTQYHYWCMGCNHIHAISPEIHSFNGDFEFPTFSPSLLQNWNPERVCHSYINNGHIEYLGDCFHALKGTRIALPHILEIKEVDGESLTPLHDFVPNVYKNVDGEYWLEFRLGDVRYLNYMKLDRNYTIAGQENDIVALLPTQE